ncbi:type I restriction-modification system M subunit [Calothrix sp. NIES-4071]|nr:type I restriction-modification system M subunit [Calothrix sp. NIES-4071]BAZ54521.1 type I restriction-modification system M subunit [Calothrix sp. NIES-4105]
MKAVEVEFVNDLLKQRNSKWKKYEYKLWSDVFTERNSNAKPVILKERKVTDDPYARVWGWYRDDKDNIERMYELDISIIPRTTGCFF